MSEPTQIRLFEEEEPVTISPRLYGHFAEHLGRCCYEGLWVGTENTEIPHEDGFRIDILDALRGMPTPLLRWPGGCYADHYHWRDGIGKPSERPRRLGLSCGLSVLDENTLGTHEFLALCQKIGAEPYLAGNVGSGSVQELCDWVEYCNASVPTALAKERERNGQAEPFGVSLWGVGNENWGCGGCYEPESYGLEYRRYASMIKHVDLNTELVVCGHDTEWNRRLLTSLEKHIGLVDHFSIHRYWIDGGSGVGFSEADYYNSLKEAGATRAFIVETRRLLDEVDPRGKIGIALDEWGVWHPEARPWGPHAKGDQSGEYLQSSTMRDAILAGVGLEVFHHEAGVLSMANLAQIVNVLHAPIQTSGSSMWLTPTYHLLKMHGRHIGQTRLRVEVVTELHTPDHSTALTAVATDGWNGRQMTVINRCYSSAVPLEIPDWAQKLEILTGPVDGVNCLEQPDHIRTVGINIPVNRVIEVPPVSILSVST